jgi:hypothetical protein
MTRIMFDSTTPDQIPADAKMVAGYVNGSYFWKGIDWRRFPNAIQVHITVSAVNTGGVLDVESGDATPDQAPGWIKARLAAGLARPAVYVNRSNLDAVIAACTAEGLVAGHHYWIWLATLDGTVPAEFPGLIAVQDKSAAILGYNADSSVVFDDTWHPTPLTDAQKLIKAGALAAEIVALVKP